ncbi:hypothetical protein Ate01nite_44920 [Actinoplanes teichomyceticus]|nr:hypothetical protein Ate01nite_44920 [Actinoplanes teichomyceticus]
MVAVVELSEGPGTGAAYVRAALGMLPGMRRGGALPDVELVHRGVTVDRSHLARYDRACGLRLTDTLPATYPHILAFPLAMRLMSAAGFPLPMIGLVHVTNRITVRRPIDAGSRLDLTVRAADLREHPRGRQFDMVATASVDGAEVWHGVSTYLHRGSGRADPTRAASAAVSASPSPESGASGIAGTFGAAGRAEASSRAGTAGHGDLPGRVGALGTAGRAEASSRADTSGAAGHGGLPGRVGAAGRADASGVTDNPGPAHGAGAGKVLEAAGDASAASTPGAGNTGALGSAVSSSGAGAARSAGAGAARSAGAGAARSAGAGAADAGAGPLWAGGAVWRLPVRTGADYAAVSGDRNPIHTSHLGARLFGFPRPIAHGMWTKARCLAALEGRLPEAYTVDVTFKQPILLPSTVRFTSSPTAAGWDFTVLTERPHLLGSITAI